MDGTQTALNICIPYLPSKKRQYLIREDEEDTALLLLLSTRWVR